MTTPPKYEDVVEKLDAALAREAALRGELGMVRKAVPNSTLELVSLQQRLTVAERERDAALAREDALRNDVLTLQKGGQLIVRDMHDYRQRLTVSEDELQTFKNVYVAANEREAGLRGVLMDAERRVGELEGLMQMFIENSDDKDVVELCEHALKPAAEDDGDDQ